MKRFCGTPADRHRTKWIPEPNSGCWLWEASANRKGYGLFKWSASEVCLAHRASWRIHRGDIPGELQVLHKCDTPSCVNPDHLFLGTNADNKADCVSKGRQARHVGEQNPRAILTAEDVVWIRRSDKSTRELAVHFGVTKQAIKLVRNGRNWRHIHEGEAAA